jgi:hypothetical protein
MPRKTLLALIAAICALAALPAAASAQTFNVAVGIGDQAESIFGQSTFQALRVKKVRYFIKWDAIDRPGELAQADAYVNAAKANRLQVLMHVSSNNLTRKAAKLPSVATYRRKVKALVDRYRPQGVRTWGSMNEANHDSQPTWNNPRRAAQFFLAMRSICRGCTIVGLDVLDQRGVERYMQRFYRALGSRRRLASIVGIHNYSDTNRYRSSGTRSIIRTAKRFNRRTQFWLTETGGVAKFGTSFPCNPANPRSAENRQRRAVRFMFTLTKRFRRDIKRLYSNNFTGADCQGRFDAGITRSDGTPRPAYNEVRSQIRRFRK